MSIDDPTLAGVQIHPTCGCDVIGIFEKVDTGKDIGCAPVSLQTYGDRRNTGSDTAGEFHINLIGQPSSSQGVIQGIALNFATPFALAGGADQNSGTSIFIF
ncbi:hypothetical protein RC74_12370 [Falsihalocynthiibacter arcticus]|uniref:Uncharacterized protein n=1 Tax=Falsihalocynthiibacter arcticus TaxID=1579316 RepID=A0A126V1B8_9RHOB|nr:hypothetical protein RC74_12370 [Falsihalocynthiibacter arcticus]